MKKIFIILITIMLFIIAGCSNKDVIKHDYTYKGENEFWTAEYKINGTDIFTEKDNKTSHESNCKGILTVTYKNNISELSSVKHLEISYENSAGGGKITEDYDDGSYVEKTYTINSGSINGAIENKDEVIKVTINLDGNIQTIELKN